MARIRTIKPEFWEDEKIGGLSHGARLLFLGCLNLSDDEGLVRWNPMYLGASLFMYDEIKSETIEKWMKELVDNELIYMYHAGKVRQTIGHILNFHKHQRIDKPQPSKLPPPNPSDARVRDAIARRDNFICHICGELVDMNAQKNICNSLAPSLDHVRPKIKGGSDYFSNLKLSHLSCNYSKGGKYSENDSENDSKNDSTPEKEKERNGIGKGIDPPLPPKGESEIEKSDFGFEKVWEMYGRKGNKKTSQKKWANLKNHCREAALKHIPLYVEATPDKQYRKNLETYLNQEAWNDEIIKKQSKNESNSRISLPSGIDYGESTI